MAESVALVPGAGALGQNVIQNLALSGIGESRVADNDVFEDHNRTRSPAFPLIRTELAGPRPGARRDTIP
ncbi:MAG: ThiF family adenylyltransferase [Gemmatimonadetes bacterium]|nr:ThiF family adenylyltransferase [Gemmatimonadota bacterium]